MNGKIEKNTEGNFIVQIDEKIYKIKQRKKSNLRFEELIEGQEVEIEKHGKKPSYYHVNKILGDSRDNRKELDGNIKKVENKKIEKNKKFDYPYNFVRVSDQVRRDEYTFGEYSGEIACSLENYSPLFIPGIKKMKGNHIEEFFLKDKEGNYIIPASSLKGTIRNVLETISNSCFLNIEENRLEERKSPGEFNDKHYGIIVKIPTEDEDGLIKEAEVVRINKNEVKNYKEGFHKLNFNHKIKKYVSNDLERNKIVLDSLEEVTSETKEIEGVLWIASDIYNKSKEKILFPKKDGRNIELSYEEYEDINYILKQRLERDKSTNKLFLIDKIKSGDAIIFQENEEKKAINLAISEIPRLRYKYSPYDLLSDKLKKCNNKKDACFACRIFGLIGNGSTEDNKGAIGKVFFSDAKLKMDSAKIMQGPILIKSLGEPHPSLSSFYLNGDNYNEKTSIRGRKFYWHHTDKIKKNYDKYKKSITPTKKENHNSSIEFMEYGNKFDFHVRFEKLTKEELGLLIYSLELDDDKLHKIGKAKALGFGSCKIIIENIYLDSEKKYDLNSFKKNYFEIDKKEFVKRSLDLLDYENSIQKKDLDIIMSKENNLDFSESPFPEAEYKGKKNTLNWFNNMKKRYKKKFRLPFIEDYQE